MGYGDTLGILGTWGYSQNVSPYELSGMIRWFTGI